MGGLIQPPPIPEERDNSRWIILIALVAIAAVVITVAGNLKDMFLNISEIANDLEFRGAVASPTIRIDGLTVGGE